MLLTQVGGDDVFPLLAAGPAVAAAAAAAVNQTESAVGAKPSSPVLLFGLEPFDLRPQIPHDPFVVRPLSLELGHLVLQEPKRDENRPLLRWDRQALDGGVVVA